MGLARGVESSMSLSEKVPLMREGANGRNVVVGVAYIVTLPIWLVFLPVIVFALVWRDYGGIASSMSSVPGISAGGGVASGVVAFVICLGLFGIIGAASSGGAAPGPSGLDTAGEDGDEPTATSVPNTGEPAADGGSDTPTSTRSPTPTTAPTPTPAPDGASYSLSGSGNDVTDVFDTEGGLVVFDLGHSGSSNFQVWAINSAGTKELLVNDIGTYDGKVALYLPSDTWRLEVTADGTWRTEVTQPRFNEQDIEALPAEADGEHAAWFGPFEFDGSTKVTFEITGDSHAAVWLTNHNGEKVDLLHNEIGPYEGTALVTDSGVGLIIVDTDSAKWRIEIGG